MPMKWTTQSSWSAFVHSLRANPSEWNAITSMGITPAYKAPEEVKSHQVRVQIRGNVIRNA